MQKFSITLDKCETLRSLSSQIDDDMMTLMVLNKTLYFVYKNNEIYLQISYMINSSYGINDEDVITLRIDKKDFLAVVCEGVVSFNILDDKVEIEFYGNENNAKYSLTLPYQEDLIDKYLNYLKLFTNCTDYPKINLMKAGDLLRIAKYIGISISSDNNYMSVNNNNNFIIYKEIENPDFTVNHKYLNLIRNIGGRAYAVGNYIVYKDEKLCIAITRQVHTSIFSGTDNIASFNKKTKPLLRVKFICKNLSIITKKLKVNEGDLYLDLNERKFDFVMGKNKVFSSPIDIKLLKDYKELAEQKTAKLDFNIEDFFNNLNDSGNVLMDNTSITKYDRIKIPGEIIRGVLNALNYDDYIDLAVKQNYYVLKIETLTIIFGKDK